MSSIPKLRVGGVPEHFNYPWFLARERGLFSKHGVEVEWVEQKEGTGQMIKSAKDGEVDMIIALTEGLVADIAKGVAINSTGEAELRLLGTYVSSPLNWAISTGASSSYHDVSSLNGSTWGVSRLTSGSHLMALVLAHQRGWDLSAQRFEPLGNFESLRNGVNQGKAAAFMWETFTTKPYHDSGEIRRIGEIATPWPCFMMAATRKSVAQHSDALLRALVAVREACAIFHAETNDMPNVIAQNYHLNPIDAKNWYDKVSIVASPSILQSALARTLSTLKEARVLPSDNPCKPQDLLDHKFARLETTDIKNMKLYNRPELITRTYNELRARGWASGNLDWKLLAEIDQQHHYHGTAAVDTAIEEAKITETSYVLSLGSGLGGPARYIAGKTGATVLAMDMQADLSQVAEELTQRTGLEERVHHIAGNFLSAHKHLRLNSYSAIVSWLTVLHISEKETLFNGCRDILAPNGIFYAEDWYARGPFTTSEQETLSNDIYCANLPTSEAYQQALEKAGLEVLKFEDLTEDWAAYSASRVSDMEANKQQLIELHGKEIYESLHFFYVKVRDLFAGGHLGGARIVARKRAPESH